MKATNETLDKFKGLVVEKITFESDDMERLTIQFKTGERIECTHNNWEGSYWLTNIKDELTDTEARNDYYL